MTDALELRARQLILCVTVWVSVSIQQHIFVATTKKKGQPVKWLNPFTVFWNNSKDKHTHGELNIDSISYI